MNDNSHILVIDDDRDTCEIVKEYLESEGYRVSTADGGRAMRRVIEQAAVDLVLLDVTLPGEDGLSLARWLRANHPNTGIIMLTGRGDIIDRIIGLEMGADDYLAKPFHLREVLARIKSLRRRAALQVADKPAPLSPRVSFAGWVFDPAARELFSPAGESVRLTRGEIDLLAAFVAHPNRLLTRDQLLAVVCNRKAGPVDRTIDVRVGRLRRKLSDHSDQSCLIKTVRDGGYMFTPAVELVADPIPGRAENSPPDRRSDRLRTA